MSDALRTAHSAAGMAADYLAEARVAAASGRPVAFYVARAAELLAQARVAIAPGLSPGAASAAIPLRAASKNDMLGAPTTREERTEPPGPPEAA